MPDYTSTALIASVKRKASVPNAQSLWSDSDFLAVADEEIRGYLLPLIRRVKEDYFLQTADFTIDRTQSSSANGQGFRIPYRAVGQVCRDIHLLDSAGKPIDGCPRVDPGELGTVAWGLYILSNLVFYLDRMSYAAPTTLRVTYYLRPSSLVLPSGAAKVAAWDFSAKTVTLDSVPAGYSTNALWDFVTGRPGFEMQGFDFPGSLDVPSQTITFTDALPPDISLGDYVCISEQSPVPQIPAELHPLLYERVAWRCLKSMGDVESAADVANSLPGMERDALMLISQRMEGEPKKILPTGGPWRRWRR